MLILRKSRNWAPWTFVQNLAAWRSDQVKFVSFNVAFSSRLPCQEVLGLQLECITIIHNRGYICEVYNGHFKLPDLGPIGIFSKFHLTLLQVLMAWPIHGIFRLQSLLLRIENANGLW